MKNLRFLGYGDTSAERQYSSLFDSQNTRQIETAAYTQQDWKGAIHTEVQTLQMCSLHSCILTAPRCVRA